MDAVASSINVLMRTKNFTGSLKDAQKLLIVANIMQECGWFAEAEKELDRCIKNFLADGKVAQEHLDKLKHVRAPACTSKASSKRPAWASIVRPSIASKRV